MLAQISLIHAISVSLPQIVDSLKCLFGLLNRCQETFDVLRIEF